jgi:hypothetical protein
MPNWCDNSVRLGHPDKTKIDELVKVIDEADVGIFQSLRPIPLDESENWYEWNVENWGTKWDAGLIDSYRDEDNAIHISMETAWAPPIALYEYLVEQGWEVDAKYLEPGMGFGGTFNNEFGDNYYEYDISDLDSIEALPEDVIDFGDLRAQYEDFKETEEDTNEA